MPQDQDQQQDLSGSQDQHQEMPGQTSESGDNFGEQLLDEHIENEREEIAEINKANSEDAKDDEEPEEAEGEGSEDDEEGAEEGDGANKEYKPNAKYKVLDEEHEFDPKLKKLLTKETEPIIRELYEKAHGIEAIKQSRTQATRERDEVQGNYNNLLAEVGRVLNYRRAGDLQSFFESVQLDDNAIAAYILEKIRVSKLPPEERAVYNERETLRRRLNGVEQNLATLQTNGSTAEVQNRLNSLDQILGGELMKQTVSDFDARNGKGSLRTAVINWAASQPKDLSANEAVEGFMKIMGINATKAPAKAQGANPTKRVVARPKVKTIPNYGGGQASVTATKKPKSVDDLRKLARGETI
jgi:hypothetical protein